MTDTTDSLAAVFVRVLGAENLSLSLPELEAVLRANVEESRRGYPQLQLSESDFVRFLAERLGSKASLGPLKHAADLWLVCACIHAVPGASELFHSLYAPVIIRVLNRRRASPTLAQDLVHNVLEKLLLPRDGKPPILTDYGGSGSLKAWVSTVAVTTLLMSRRASERRREDMLGQDVLEARLADDGGELQFLKQHYRKPVEAAISSALSQLSDRERMLLRLHLVERMSIDRLGVMYGVNRATAARWLANARGAVLKATHAQVRQDLRVSESECLSLINLVGSQLQVSIARHL